MKEKAMREGGSSVFQYGPRLSWLESEVPASVFGLVYAGTAETVLQMAELCLIKNGVDGLSLRQVSADSGISLAALQYHFRTRDDLVVSVVNRRVQGYLSELEQSMDDMENAIDLLCHTADRLIEDSLGAGLKSFEIPFWALASTSDGANKTLVSYMRVYRAIFTNMVIATNPRLSIEIAAARAAILIAMIEGTLPTLPDSAGRQLSPLIRSEALRLVSILCK